MTGLVKGQLRINGNPLGTDGVMAKGGEASCTSPGQVANTKQ